METCDDCHKQYPGPAYYTFEADGCNVIEVDAITGAETPVPHDCTENMCPDCAGPYLEPDTDGDPRRPSVTFRYVLVQAGDPINGSDMGIAICLGKDVTLIQDLRVTGFYANTKRTPIRIRTVEAERDLTYELIRWAGMATTNLLGYKEVT
jgi:hypothetical protein